MAGIYIHIPFCKKICYYCDFFKSRELSLKEDFLNALRKEIALRRDYLQDEAVETVYFGGGTPSVLSVPEVSQILETLAGAFSITKDAEITFECNPEDLTGDYLKGLRETGINRLSIGCQSFYDKHLKLMNRRHDAAKGRETVTLANEAGFANISVDLIYGFPEMTLKEWENNLDEVLSLPVRHLSAYILNVEENTVFDKWLQKGKISLPEDREVVAQYQMLVEKTGDAAMIHYEISNFGKERYFSRHNMLYWNRRKYIGLGPGAHSYDLESRQWNVENVTAYIEGLERGEVTGEKEKLDIKMQFNDYIITALRTMWGADIEWMKSFFPEKMVKDFIKNMNRMRQSGLAREKDDHLILTDQGIMISDTILAECMI